MLLKISQILQENICIGVSLIKSQAFRCFPVKYAEFSRTPILKKICEWLFLKIKEGYLQYYDFDIKILENTKSFI